MLDLVQQAGEAVRLWTKEVAEEAVQARVDESGRRGEDGGSGGGERERVPAPIAWLSCALATPHGSVATLIARDLAGEPGERRWARVWIPATAAAVALATLLLWATF